MKKYISIILTIILVLTCGLSVAGCTPNTDDPQKTPKPKPTKSGEELVSYPVYSSLFEKIEYVNMLTGKNAQPDTLENFLIGGTDLGIPCYDDVNKKMYFWFGDTFSGVNTMQGDWRSNVVGITTDFDASDGVTFDTFYHNGFDQEKYASAIFDGAHQGEGIGEKTRIPTGAICIDGVQYSFFMSIRKWNNDATWDVNYCSCFKSTDDGKSWSMVNNISWVGENDRSIKVAQNKMVGLSLSEEEANSRTNDNFMMVYPYRSGEYVYLFGMTGGRSGALKLARAKAKDFENFDSYEYYVGKNQDGSAKWVAGKEGLKMTKNNLDSYIISSRVGEVSVAYNKYLEKYMLTYETGGVAYLNLSDDLINWSKGHKIITNKEQNRIYGPFIHEMYMEEDGKVVYFFLSNYTDESNAENEDAYNVRVMKMTLK